jgi:DNA phosphorothioation-dependent restriction protein DptH
MPNNFQELTDEQFTRSLEEFIFPRLRSLLLERQPGHCMRVTDLELPLTVALARRLRGDSPRALVHILGETEGGGPLADDLFISSTKLVELRNPPADGELRPPLLVFVPPDLRSSVEDSLSVATFEDVPLGHVYGEMAEELLQSLPVEWRGTVRAMLSSLPKQPWRWADPVAQVRFLLTAIRNGGDAESVGASLYELGLVPDLRLLDDPARATIRWQQNAEAMRKLTYSDLSLRGRVADLGITDKEVQRHLTNFLLGSGADEPSWTRRVALDRQHSKTITWDKWKLKTLISAEQVTISNVELDLGRVAGAQAAGALQGLAGEYFLDPGRTAKLKVSFSVDPPPGQVEGLDHFTVQIISENGGPVGAAKSVKAGVRNRAGLSATLDKLNQIEFEEGWYFVRVLPWTKEKDPVPLAGDGRSGPQPNESEAFYVVTETETDDEPEKRRVDSAVSLEHARLDLQFTGLQEAEAEASLSVCWAERPTPDRPATQQALEVKFGRSGAYRVLVAPQLQQIERQTITAVEPRVWRVHVKSGKPGEPHEEAVEWPRSAAFESFLAARGQYFAALSGGEKELVTQGADLLSLADACAEYAESYRDFLRDLQVKISRAEGPEQHHAIAALRAALAIDMVRVSVTDFAGRTREAALLGPTHPLRALWLVVWARLGQHWLDLARRGAAEFVGPARDAVLNELVPLNMPALLPLTHGRVLTCLDNVHPFWALYAAADEDDPRGLVGEVCAALNLEEPAIGGAVVTKEVLTRRVERYLSQHPYLRTLVVNAFNPGRAAVLAEAVRALTQRPALAHLRYDLRLFVPDPESPGVGQALEDLLALSEEDDEGEAPARRSHLFPKLSLAIHGGDDFQRAPQSYRAHISLLFDLFPAAAVGVAAPWEADGSAPVHGLVQDFLSAYQDDEAGQFWRRQARAGEPQPLPGAEHLSGLLAELPKLMSGAAATAAVGAPAFEQRPVVTLGLDARQRALIYDVHEVSDWVFTIDRNLGIEYFDHGRPGERPDYLIDYVPGPTASQGHRLMITSRSLDEIQAMLQPVLQRHRLPATPKHAGLILDQLRAFSGRLALKLVSHETQQKEALGLALARLYLRHQGVLSNQIVVPLDAHLDLFRAAKKLADDSGLEGTLQRTDLAAFDLDAASRTVACRLVEVKCHDHGSGLAEYAHLKQAIAAQVGQSEQVLRLHFDPALKSPDRPDRLLKSRELGSLLNFYLERSARYRLIEPEAAAEARTLLATLDGGYRLRFTRSALIFDFEKGGADDAERENGIEFYRVGKDLIGLLVAQAAGDVTEADVAATLPRLSSAAFVAEPRERPISFQSKDRPTAEAAAAPPPAAVQAEAALGLLAAETDRGAVGLPVPADELPDSTSAGGDESPEPGRNKHTDENTVVDVYLSQVGKFVKVGGQQGAPAAATSQLEEPAKTAPPNEPPATAYDVMIGVSGDSPQYGLLGEVSGRKVALDLNQTHTISLFGVQGGGKSYTLGSIIEMTCLPLPNINLLPKPLATVVFHYSPTLDYKPEFTSMVRPNTDPAQVRALGERYGAAPQSLADVVILTPASKVEERRAEYPGLEVLPICFAASELKAAHWKFLMGAVGSQSLYLRQVTLLMRRLRDSLTLDALSRELEQSGMADHLKELARTRLSFAAEYIDDGFRLSEIIRPGRLMIVDLRDEFIEKDEALGLFVVMLQILSEASHEGQAFNKLVVFDEAHKYIKNEDLISGLIEVVREMRHKGTSILVASQDPPSVPVPLIELSSQIILHKFNSPAWLRHIQKANAALDGLTPKQMSDLGPGEAYLWSSKAGDELFTKGAVKIKCRPRVTEHGGGTKTAL